MSLVGEAILLGDQFNVSAKMKALQPAGMSGKKRAHKIISIPV